MDLAIRKERLKLRLARLKMTQIRDSYNKCTAKNNAAQGVGDKKLLLLPQKSNNSSLFGDEQRISLRFGVRHFENSRGKNAGNAVRVL